MIELLVTTLSLFVVFTILFSIPVIVHYLRFIMNVAQFILNILLLLKIFYKKHSLWIETNIQPIHQLPFYPLSNISYTNSNTSNYNNYSLTSEDIKINQFSYTKCGKIYIVKQVLTAQNYRDNKYFI